MCDGDDCCKKIAKIILVIVNLFFLLLGLLMLSFGIAMVAAPHKIATTLLSIGDAEAYLKFLGDIDYIIKAAGIFMIILGGIVALIGAFGFFGACCESRVLLTLYLIVVIIILLAEIALIIFAACFPSQFENEAKKTANNTMIQNFTQDVQIFPNVTFGSDYAFGYSWAALQFGARCCGTNGPSDYQDQNRYTPDKRQIRSYLGGVNQAVNYPISCCKLKSNVEFPNVKSTDDFENLAGCLAIHPLPAAPGSYNDKDCYAAVQTTIKQAARIAIGIAAAIVAIQVIIVIFGFILCCSLHRDKSGMV